MSPVRPTSPLVIVVLALLLAATAGCGHQDQPSGAAHTSARSLSPATAGPTSSTTRSARPSAGSPAGRALALDDPYQRVGRLLHAHGTRVWWESDLVARWLEGPASFTQAVRRLAVLARQPGTAGIKVADELGYHDGLDSPAEAQRFLRDAHAALATAAPHVPVLVDVVVLELGCLPRSSGSVECVQRARATAPASTYAAITSYLRAGLIDRLDVSTGLGVPNSYPGGDLALAQDRAWSYVARGSWPSLAAIQSRKALAAQGGYVGNTARDLHTYVDVPHARGARATDLWTWRQRYQGSTWSLFGTDITLSRLWQPLLAERRRGVRLFTHMTPSAMPTDPAALANECALATQVFSDVFVAAGTG